MSLLVLSKSGGHHTTRFINADVDFFRTSQSRMRVAMNHLDELIAISHGPEDGLLNQPSGLVVDVPVKKILDNGAQLQVSSYLLPIEQQTLGFLLQDIPTRDLGDLVETLRPTLLKRKNGKSVQIREVGTADLPSYGSMRSLGKETEVPAELVEKGRLQFLAPGDIVLMVKGNVGKVGIVPDSAPPPGPGGWVLGQSTIALRVKPEIGIDPRAIFMLLRSPLGQGLLACIVLGATIPLISMRHLMQLEVPLPSPEESASAVDILAREDELQRQIDELAAQQSKLARDLWSLDLV